MALKELPFSHPCTYCLLTRCLGGIFGSCLEGNMPLTESSGALPGPTFRELVPVDSWAKACPTLILFGCVLCQDPCKRWHGLEPLLPFRQERQPGPCKYCSVLVWVGSHWWQLGLGEGGNRWVYWPVSLWKAALLLLFQC